LGARGGAGTTTAAINIAACLASMGIDTILADLDLVQGHIAGYLNQPVHQNIGRLFGTPLQEWPPALEDFLLRRDKHWELLLTHPHLHESPAISEQAVDRLVDMLDATGKTSVMDLGIQFGPQMLPAVRRADQVLLCLRPERTAIDAACRLIPYLREQRPVEESLHVIMLDFRIGGGLPRSAVENYIKYPLFDVLHIYGADLADAVNAGKSLVEMHPFAPVSYHFQELTGRLGVVEQKV
jgi:pilus assembly protein CpaE